MITRFNIFEGTRKHDYISKLLEIGDYVVCEEEKSYYSDALNEFLFNNVGRIVEKGGLSKYVLVEYENIPIEVKKYFNEKESTRIFRNKFILYHSKDKKDCEIFIDTNKYNL